MSFLRRTGEILGLRRTFPHIRLRDLHRRGRPAKVFVSVKKVATRIAKMGMSTRAPATPPPLNKKRVVLLLKMPERVKAIATVGRKMIMAEVKTERKKPRDLQEAVMRRNIELSEIKSKLVRVTKIRDVLDQNHCVVVHGSGGTGKSEQLKLAVGDSLFFELRDSFLEEARPGEWVKGDEYNTMKEEEHRWLKKNYQNIKRSLLDHPSKTIVLDEFDLSASDKLNKDELASCKLIVDLASELKEAGKDVALVMHNVGVSDQDLKAHLNKQALVTDDSQVVETGRFTPKEEYALLKAAGFSKPHAIFIQRTLRGMGSAYVNILKRAAKGNPLKASTDPEAFLSQARVSSKNLMKIAERTKDSKILELRKKVPLLDPKHKISYAEFLRYLRREETEQTIAFRIKLHKHGVPVNGSNVSVLFRGNPMVSELYNALKKIGKVRCFSTKVGEDGVNMLLSSNQEKIQQGLDERFSAISSQVKVLKLPSPNDKGREDWWKDWENSAETVDELFNLAQEFKNPFLELVGEVAKKTGARKDTGKNDKYATKTKESLERKVSGYTSNGSTVAEATASVNDCLRATLVCSTWEDFSETAKALYDTLREHGLEDDDIICMDKYESSDPTSNPYGYGALHFTFRLRKPGTDRVITSEVQIHHGKPYEIKGLLHPIYEHTRLRGAPEAMIFRGIRASQAYSWLGHQSIEP